MATFVHLWGNNSARFTVKKYRAGAIYEPVKQLISTFIYRILRHRNSYANFSLVDMQIVSYSYDYY